MAFSYAVIRKDGKDWRVSVNDFGQTHEVVKKTLPEILAEAKRLIESTET